MNSYPFCPQCQQTATRLDQNADVDEVAEAPTNYCFTYICDKCGERLTAEWHEHHLPSAERELLQAQKIEAERVRSQRSQTNTVNVAPTCQRCNDVMEIDRRRKPESMSTQKVRIRYKCHRGELEYGMATWDRNRLPYLEANWCRDNDLPVT